MPDKQTKRERRELAKRERLEHQRRAARRRVVRRIQSALVVLVVIGGIVALVMLSGKGSKDAAKKVAALATAAGCGEIQRPADQGAGHLKQGETFPYSTDPPTSGKHAESIGPTGVLPSPAGTETQVHNLEHGHTGIQYKATLAPPVKDALEKLVRDKFKTSAFMAPRESQTATLAITSWTRLVECATPADAGAVTKFVAAYIDAFRGDSPEGFRAGSAGA